jgi:NAD(P)-dependent dehydrogenase (short-subunit alcohol dehydrogenase family)
MNQLVLQEHSMVKGKSVIITGAASGIGRATAVLLAKAEAKVIVTDISPEGEGTVAEIKAAGGEAIFIRADLGVEEEVKALVAGTVKKYGRLDGAFNNAGLEACFKPLHELTTTQWQRAILVDLTAVFYCLKYQIIAMLETGGGSIINTASSLGVVAIPNQAEYVAAKHGVIGLTKSAAVDYSAKKIRVNAVLPGVIQTPMIKRALEDPRFSAAFDKLREHHPIGRFGEPNEIGEAVKWLLSDASSFVTGASLPVDGGYLTV